MKKYLINGIVALSLMGVLGGCQVFLDTSIDETINQTASNDEIINDKFEIKLKDYYITPKYNSKGKNKGDYVIIDLEVKNLTNEEVNANSALYATMYEGVVEKEREVEDSDGYFNIDNKKIIKPNESVIIKKLFKFPGFIYSETNPRYMILNIYDKLGSREDYIQYILNF